MERDYDTQLLESVNVRRRRLRDALLFGRLRSRRTVDENLVKVFASICVAAVVCAGSVGWAFVQRQRHTGPSQAISRPAAVLSAPTPTPTDGGAESWAGRTVTLPMLAAALKRAGVPDGLYWLARVHEAATDSHYFLAPRSTRWQVGVVDGDDERTGPDFAAGDAACRWLYNELVFAEPPPVRLTTGADHDARRRADVVVRRLDAAFHPQTITPQPRPSTTPAPKTSAPKTPTLKTPTLKTRAPKPAPTSLVITLKQGFVVDQYGQESGRVFVPYGRVPSGRAGQGVPHQFQVAKPLPVRATEVGDLTVDGSLFNERPSLPTVRWLLHHRYLRRVIHG